MNRDISHDERRYILDWIREYRFGRFLAAAQARVKQQLEAHLGQDPRDSLELRRQTEPAWNRAVTLSRIDAAYTRGEYEAVVELLDSYNGE